MIDQVHFDAVCHKIVLNKDGGLLRFVLFGGMFVPLFGGVDKTFIGG